MIRISSSGSAGLPWCLNKGESPHTHRFLIIIFKIFFTWYAVQHRLRCVGLKGKLVTPTSSGYSVDLSAVWWIWSYSFSLRTFLIPWFSRNKRSRVCSLSPGLVRVSVGYTIYGLEEPSRHVVSKNFLYLRKVHARHKAVSKAIVGIVGRIKFLLEAE